MATPSHGLNDHTSSTPLALVTFRHGHGEDSRCYLLHLTCTMSTWVSRGGSPNDCGIFNAHDCLRLATVDDFGDLRPARVQ